MGGQQTSLTSGKELGKLEYVLLLSRLFLSMQCLTAEKIKIYGSREDW